MTAKNPKIVLYKEEIEGQESGTWVMLVRTPRVIPVRNDSAGMLHSIQTSTDCEIYKNC